jgi:hypothetical protein
MDSLPTAADTKIASRPDIEATYLEDQEHLDSPVADTEEG